MLRDYILLFSVIVCFRMLVKIEQSYTLRFRNNNYCYETALHQTYKSSLHSCMSNAELNHATATSSQFLFYSMFASAQSLMNILKQPQYFNQNYAGKASFLIIRKRCLIDAFLIALVKFRVNVISKISCSYHRPFLNKIDFVFMCQ